MCLIAVAARPNMIPRDNLQNAYDHNSDGWGFMYAHQGRVHVMKERSGMNRFFDAWDTVPKERAVAVHFRFGTSGPKDDSMCHPFQVLSADKDGMDLWMMHNGVLSEFNGDKTRSDTVEMVQETLTPLLRGKPGFVRTEAFARIAECLIGGGNKLVFLEGSGRWHFINKSLGSTIGRVWYSNEYSIKKVYSGFGKGKAASREDDDWGFGGGYWDSKERRWHEPEKRGALIPHYMRNAHTGAIEYTGAKANIVRSTSGAGTVVEGNFSADTNKVLPSSSANPGDAGALQIPLEAGAGVAELTSHAASTMREGTVATLAGMGAIPKAPDKVAAAIAAGATLADSDASLMFQHGITLSALAQFIMDGCSYMLRSARGNLDGIRALRSRAWDALYLEMKKPDCNEPISEQTRAIIQAANERFETPLDRLARDAHNGTSSEAVASDVVIGEANSVAVAEDDPREFWNAENLWTCEPEDILAAVQSDPEGAADFIMSALDYMLD